jgi:hypothetical protein
VKKVYAGDENLRKIENEYYPILKILKNEINKYFSNNNELDLIEITDLNGNIEKFHFQLNQNLEISQQF